MSKTVFAVAAHPDDIEFMMSGTLFLLKDAGWNVHYMNIANGCCGTDTLEPEEIVSVRRAESEEACRYLGAVFHESLVNDLEIFYGKKLISEMASVIRQVAPDIILTQYPFEYMEDHSITASLVATAAFCRNMKNLKVQPHADPFDKNLTVYHSMPYGLADPLKRPVTPDFYVDVSGVIDRKTNMLSLHRSQKEWLDVSQGMDSYLASMQQMCLETGKRSRKFKYAEGWIKRLHLGFCAAENSPLENALAQYVNM